MPAKQTIFRQKIANLYSLLLLAALFSMTSLSFTSKMTFTSSIDLSVDLSAVKSLFSQQPQDLRAVTIPQTGVIMDVQVIPEVSSGSTELTVTDSAHTWEKVKITVVKLDVFSAPMHVVSTPAEYSLILSGSNFSLEQASLDIPSREREVRTHVSSRDFINKTVIRLSGLVYEQTSLDGSYQSSECLRVPSVKILLC